MPGLRSHIFVALAIFREHPQQENGPYDSLQSAVLMCVFYATQGAVTVCKTEAINVPMKKDHNVDDQLARIKDFGEWLKVVAPGWTISIPEVEHIGAGAEYITFSLCRGGLAIGLCDSPEDALAKIRDDRLFALYLQRAYGLLVLNKKGLLEVWRQ